LADTAAFIDGKNEEFINDTGSKPDWVLVGGSYPGALTAWFKSKYPDHIIGGWSSSGVINAVNDFSNFDYSNYNNTLLSGALCPKLIQD
jgi:pimeloyl-ACP methyl ester carboxylesterase